MFVNFNTVGFTILRPTVGYLRRSGLAIPKLRLSTKVNKNSKTSIKQRTRFFANTMLEVSWIFPLASAKITSPILEN